jgi:hypothetical protein
MSLSKVPVKEIFSSTQRLLRLWASVHSLNLVPLCVSHCTTSDVQNLLPEVSSSFLEISTANPVRTNKFNSFRVQKKEISTVLFLLQDFSFSYLVCPAWIYTSYFVTIHPYSPKINLKFVCLLRFLFHYSLS